MTDTASSLNSKSDYTLYGMQASLYTGKVRAYMRRNRIPVTESGAGHPDYTGVIFPHMGRFIMPVVVTPSGDVLQDGTDILDHFEAQGLGLEPLYPEDPVIKAIALLFELFGNEGLLRPAMHYRWNFDADNLDFIRVSFSDVLPAHLDAPSKAAAFDKASGRMRKAAMAFGVFPQTYQNVEDSYAEFLALLNAHFENTYYLLGPAPTIADYGLFNPLYAHLARDPKPAHLMKTTAPHVWNWVERVNRPEHLQEHVIKNAPNTIITTDKLPETLKALMVYAGEEYAAEFTAHVEFANSWLAEHSDEPEKLAASHVRGLGFAPFKWRGHEIKSVVMLYRFYLAQRLWDHFDGCAGDIQSTIRSVFSDGGLEPFLDVRPSRRVIRKNYHEVWADMA